MHETVLDETYNDFLNRCGQVEICVPDESGGLLAFGLIPTDFGIESEPETNNRPISHVVLKTKPYRDYGCAAYKLCEFLKNNTFNKSYIQAPPKVTYDKVFFSGIGFYVGRMRFSYEAEG